MGLVVEVAVSVGAFIAVGKRRGAQQRSRFRSGRGTFSRWTQYIIQIRTFKTQNCRESYRNQYVLYGHRPVHVTLYHITRVISSINQYAQETITPGPLLFRSLSITRRFRSTPDPRISHLGTDFCLSKNQRACVSQDRKCSSARLEVLWAKNESWPSRSLLNSPRRLRRPHTSTSRLAIC